MSTEVVADSAAESGFHWPLLRDIKLSAPLRWVNCGFHDMLAAPVASLFYGVVLAVMGYLLTHFYGGAVGLALTTGFLLIGPFLAVGLYDISRQIETTNSAQLAPTLSAWRDNLPAIGFYALILMLSLAVWMRVSVVLIALFIPSGVESLQDLLAILLRSPDAWVFALVYITVGAVLAAFSFASSAVALPLLRDHPTADAVSAMMGSTHRGCHHRRLRHLVCRSGGDRAPGRARHLARLSRDARLRDSRQTLTAGQRPKEAVTTSVSRYSVKATILSPRQR
jgi:uncharacterized membrane protein